MLMVEQYGMKSNKTAERGFIYVLQANGVAVYKIGHTVNLRRRMTRYRRKYRFPVRYIVRIETNDCEQLETYFQRQFHNYRLIGEWFLLPPAVIKQFTKLEQLSRGSV